MSNWFELAIMNPYARQRPLCIHGPQQSGKTLLIAFLKGYFLPMKAVELKPTDYNATLNGWLLEGELMILYHPPKELPSRAKQLEVHTKRQPMQVIRNRTKWIIESLEPLDGCMNLELEHKLGKPTYPTIAQATQLGIEMRAAGIRLTPHLLKGVLK